MHRVCILTDSSVQFTQSDYLGNEFVSIIPFLKPGISNDVLGSLSGMGERSVITIRPIEEILGIINAFPDHPDILVITLSSALSDLFSVIEKSVEQLGAIGRIKLIDSHTTSIGMGILVQQAAGLAAKGEPLEVIEHQLRISLGKIYTLLCLPDLTYLAAANFLTRTQAVVGEMLGVLPIFSLENGCLTSIQKVRTQRHLLETFQEFVDEFDNPFYVAVVKKTNQPKTYSLKEYIKENFPQTKFGEHPLGDPLVRLLGPQSVGLIVIEDHLGEAYSPFSRIH